jgi:hypothetical protein
MIIALFLRRLREGVSFDDFVSAWEADKGFGVPTRVFNAVSLHDPRDVLSIGYVDVDASDLESALASVSEQEALRHSQIDQVVESTEVRGFFDVRTEHDFSAAPRSIELGSAESLLGGFR